MANSCAEDIIQWKQCWQLVSGIHFETPQSKVLEKLRELSAHLIDGIKPSIQPAAEKIKQSKDACQKEWLQFIENLQQYLGINFIEANQLFSYYLINEYRGSTSSLAFYLSTESNMTKLLDDIWDYYTLDRMIKLKIVKNLLEHYKSTKHIYSKEYNTIVNELKLSKLRQSYIEQFEYLLKDCPPIRFTNGDVMNAHAKLTAWSERRCWEIIEILQIIVLCVDADWLLPQQFKKLIELFKLHLLGRQTQFLDGTNRLHQDLMKKLIYAHVGLFIKCTDVMHRQLSDEQLFECRQLLDNEIMSWYQYPEHGPLLLTWMLFAFCDRNVVNDDEDNNDATITARKYRQFGTKATQLGVFEYLYEMFSDSLYQDKSFVSNCIRKSMYNHLCLLCDLFDDDGSVANHRGVYNLACELLKTPALAKDFCSNTDTGLRSLYNTAMENFGIDFTSLSNIAHSLTVALPKYNNINNELSALPIYSEIYASGRLQVKSMINSSTSDVKLLENYRPFETIDYKIPAGTNAVIIERGSIETIHFRYPVNYYNVLHNEIIQLLNNAQSTDIDTEQIVRVTAGLKYLSIALTRIDNPSKITVEMIHPIEMVFDILLKFKTSPVPPITLLATCVKICESLLPLYHTEILTRMVKLNIFPYITNDTLDYRSYANGINFSPAIVGHFLINFEKQLGKYDFLMAYLNFVRTCSENTTINGTTAMTIEMPALIFLLQEVFAYVHTWRFDDELDRQALYKVVLEMLFDVLLMKNENDRQLLRNVCVYSLLNFDNGMALLKFIAVGNDSLNTFMLNESNWLTGSFTGFNWIIQQTMKILMKILKLKSTVYYGDNENDSTKLTPLETFIYTQPKQRDTLRIIPVVTNYMNNTFNSRLPVLACRLLCTFAMEFRMSLLACLDLEPYQIRLTFLMRLCDEMESDNLKIAVIEFVEACIHTQPGLTEVFFKIVYKRENRFLPKIPKTKNIAEGIPSYMKECLAAVRADSNVIVSPLLGKILSLFHALWKNSMQSLVQDLVDADDFWSSLLSPLFTKDIVLDIQTYSQLFNIIGVELFKCTTAAANSSDESNGTIVNDNFCKEIEKFFQPQIFRRWIDAILTNLPTQNDSEQNIFHETPEWLSRLQSFKDMCIIVIRKRWHRIKITDECYKYFADRCLATLVERSELTNDYWPFIILSELFLVILMNFNYKYTKTIDEDNLMMQQITILLNTLAVSHQEIHCRAKESILTIAFKSIDCLFSNENSAYENPTISSNFIRSICEILCQEITQSEGKLARSSSVEDTNDLHLPFLLSVNVLKKFITTIDQSTNNQEIFYTHLVSNKIYNRVLYFLHLSLPIYEWRKVSLELLDLLITFANCSCSNELLHMDIAYHLWLKLLPPRDLLRGQYSQVSSKTNNSQQQAVGAGSAGTGATSTLPIKWQTSDWWSIYEHGIRFVMIMLKRHRFFFLKDSLMFVGVHEEYLIDSILLAKTAMNPDAMLLIRTTLEFVAELLVYEKEWRLDHPQSMMSLMRCIQIMLDHAVTLIHRPKYLRQLANPLTATNITDSTFMQSSSSSLTSDALVKAMNNVIEVITICVKCLLAFSPKLINLIADIEFSTIEWQPLVEIQFGAPNLNIETAVPQLTFGLVVSAACILTKILNLKKYSLSDVAINCIDATGEHTQSVIDFGSTSILDETTPTITERTATAAKRSHRSDGISSSPSSSQPQSTGTHFRPIKSLSTSSTSSTDQFNELLISLDSRQCLIALEYIMTLLASQSLLALKDINLSNREKQLIKRELSTELSVFFDYVKKQVTINNNRDLIDKNASFYRRKYGAIPLNNNNDGDNVDFDGTIFDSNLTQQQQQTAIQQRNRTQQQPDVLRKSMRVQLARKLHSQKTSPVVAPSSSRNTFDLSRNISPIGVSTPKKSNLNWPSSTPFDRGTESNNEIDMLEPSEPEFTGLSKVKLVDKDYLHLLSNLFQHIICQND